MGKGWRTNSQCRQNREMIEKVGSSEPICKSGFTSLLNVSRMNSNPSGSDCSGHTMCSMRLAPYPQFYYVSLKKRNFSLHEGIKLYQQWLKSQIAHNNSGVTKQALYVTKYSRLRLI
jgi:hypothetical protein